MARTNVLLLIQELFYHSEGMEYLYEITFLIASMCQWYIVSYPFLFSQMNPQFGDPKKVGEELADAEDEEKGLLSYINLFIKYSFFYYIWIVPIQIGWLYFFIIYFLGWPLAYVFWYVFCRSNIIIAKFGSLVLGFISLILLTLANFNLISL